MLSKEKLQEIISDNFSQVQAEMATELLSLREQLAELKALEPVAWRNRFTGYLHSNKPGIVDDCYDELFTAAKPAEASRESIEVQLPDQRDENFDTDTAYNEGLSAAANALRTAGIRIKGESE
ncbi:hypothetical protein LNQ51_16070 [Yersinia ruckeri]|uniref:hypothetical protein n=1 Tax=Yersinia ruckeri TaxID=29486 RepID=UPI0020BDAD3D|nr:hypothetical protein [Yersinia ruckeri]MCK8586367.1 hypothetical protein [Yersinia ruckeri]